MIQEQVVETTEETNKADAVNPPPPSSFGFYTGGNKVRKGRRKGIQGGKRENGMAGKWRGKEYMKMLCNALLTIMTAFHPSLSFPSHSLLSPPGTRG